MIRAICLLLALTGPAVASHHSWPALHDVIGVLGDDVLTALPSDTSDIEVIRPNDDLTWGLVNVNEGVGWVSLMYLARQTKQPQPAFPAITQCFGTEPFWSTTFDDPAVLVSIPDVPLAKGFISGVFAS